MPVLARHIGAPLSVDIGYGALDRLPRLLLDRRISSGGRVAIVVGPGQGRELLARTNDTLGYAKVWTVEGGGLEAAIGLASDLRKLHFDAIVGMGGGRTLDIAKYASSLTGLPMVAVATSLSHDGIASPVASLEHEGRKGSYGVHIPIALIVDLDSVRHSPASMRRSGVGDVLSNLSAVADWRLAAQVRSEELDGLATGFAHTAAGSIVDRSDGIEDDNFLVALAEALVLSGLAMATAGSSRPCSGGEHEIIHAIDQLFPDLASHGEIAGVATLFSFFIRRDEKMLAKVRACLTRHELPRTPEELGLSEAQFAQAVGLAPSTRPDRYTILEHLNLAPHDLSEQVLAFSEAAEARSAT